MRKVILTLVAILTICTSLSLLAVSCIPLASDVQLLTDTNRQLQSSFVELKNAVKESEVIDQDRADKVFDGVETVLADMEDVATAIEGKEGMDAVKEGVKATSGWNPYAVLILTGINIIEGLGLFGLGKQSKDRKTALREVVVGVEKLKANGIDNAEIKKAMSATESLRTKNIVSLIRNEV